MRFFYSFFSTSFSLLVSLRRVYSFFLVFFYKMQVHPLDSEQDNHILPFPTASLRHSILSFVSTEIAECLHKNGPFSSRLSPRVSQHLRGCNFHSPKNLEKTPTFFRKSPRNVFLSPRFLGFLFPCYTLQNLLFAKIDALIVQRIIIK